MARQEPRRNVYSATFVPKQRTTQEKMWVTIVRKPEFLTKSTDDLLQVFQPHFICQNRDLNVLKKDQSEILFEEKDTFCYGQANRYTMGRITRGTGSVTYFAYRADVPELADDRRDFVMKTLTSAPLDASGGNLPVNSSTAPGSNSSTGASAGSE